MPRVASINEEAIALVEASINERLQELVPDLVRYVRASNEAGKIGINIALTPDKKTPGAYWVSVTPKLNVKGIESMGPASLEMVGDEIQLKIAGMEPR